MYKRHENRRTRPALDDIVESPKIESFQHSKAFVIIDGLDELSEEDGARTEFLTAVMSLTAPVNLMVTSWDLLLIMPYFEEA
jgi:hypothetical protein